jgi:hypothetical protein
VEGLGDRCVRPGWRCDLDRVLRAGAEADGTHEEHFAPGGHGIKADFDPKFGPHTGAIWISSLRRDSNRTWTASGINLGNGVGKLTSVAYCGRVPKTTQHSASAVVPAQKRRSATATCPKDQALAFGGFVAPLKYHGEFVQIDRALRASGRAWTARAINTSTSLTTGTLRSLAYCRSRR